MISLDFYLNFDLNFDLDFDLNFDYNFVLILILFGHKSITYSITGGGGIYTMISFGWYGFMIGAKLDKDHIFFIWVGKKCITCMRNKYLLFFSPGTSASLEPDGDPGWIFGDEGASPDHW